MAHKGAAADSLQQEAPEAATISLLSAWQNVLAICNADKILTNGLYICLKKLLLATYALESCGTLMVKTSLYTLHHSNLNDSMIVINVEQFLI